MVGTTRVLQVDDEQEFLEMSAALLERTGERIEVDTAVDGESALERLAAGDVHCVVSDYDMPGMDGLELLRAVRERHPRMPFILLTARGSEAVASEAISAGVDDYLQKGGGDEQYQLLANRVRNLVRQARAETSYRETFENASVGLSIRDEDTGELIDANRRYCELLGYPKEDLLDVPFEELSVTDEGFTLERALEHIHAAGDDDLETFEWLYRTADGDRLWVEARMRLAEIEGERRVLASVQDVTERKAREQDLAESRGYYETIAASLPNAAVAIYDESLTYQFVDGGVFDDLAVDPADLEGEGFASAHSGSFVDDHREEYVAALDGGRAVFEFECEDRSFRGHALPVTDEDDAVIAGMVVGRDVTAERERRHRLEQVASLLSHDLANPLSVASGAVELAVEDDDTDPLEDARAALDRMGDIVDDAVAMTGIEVTPENLEPVALDRAARNAWRTVDTDGAELDAEAVEIRADGGGLRRMLENCFVNAISHGDADVVRVERAGDGFAVADDGAGLAGDPDRVFETGYTTDDEGTGLGLAIVSAAAEAHGWSVAAGESDAGGARFVVDGVDVVD